MYTMKNAISLLLLFILATFMPQGPSAGSMAAPLCEASFGDMGSPIDVVESGAWDGQWYNGYVGHDTLVKEDNMSQQGEYVLVVHGGAGTILKKNMTDELEEAYMDGLRSALQKGYAVIADGGASLDAVQAAVEVLENNPLFNAGKGAVFTHEGRNELDASIMDGHTLRAGAVASVTTIKNPIKAARAVMEQSEHVMLIGKGAEQFAAQQGLETADPTYFFTEQRWRGLQNAKKRDSLKTMLDHDSGMIKPDLKNNDYKFGTVGAVAVDEQGNLAAATSTGGMTNKRLGRVGDSPIIGAGTYADNATVAISATGWGEFFIRSVAAYDVAAMMSYQSLPVQIAAQKVVEKIGDLGGDGGLIAIDRSGNIAMPFNTEGMYRGAIKRDGTIEIFIYK